MQKNPFQTWKKVGTVGVTSTSISEAQNYIMGSNTRGSTTNIGAAFTKAIEILSSSRRTE